jgi:hypothetical protein
MINNEDMNRIGGINIKLLLILFAKTLKRFSNRQLLAALA